MKCQYQLAWTSCRTEPDESGFCKYHKGIKCSICGNQANRECSHTGQFVCGAPLCENCEGYQTGDPNDTTGHGAWGFLRHSHRRKIPQV